MKQKIFLFLAFLGISFIFSLNCRAEEQEKIDYNLEYTKKYSFKHYTMPIPTLKEPNNDKYFSRDAIYLTGLTPNKSRISIYIDGLYQGEATVNEDKNGTANFYFKVDKDIKVGVHKWSVIAWSINERERSFVSSENIFSLEIKERRVVDLTENNNVDYLKSEDVLATSTEDSVISSIKEEIANDVKVNTEDGDANIIIFDDGDSNVNVNVTSSEENILVVDKSKSEEISSETTQKLQGANVNEDLIQDIKNDIQEKEGSLEKIYKLEKDKIMGIGLLFVVLIASFVGFVLAKKKK